MVKKIIVNKKKCIGCGTCVALAPNSFKFDDDNLAEAQNPTPDDEETIKMAIDSCPVQAIETKK